jgi:hypothetical protein
LATAVASFQGLPGPDFEYPIIFNPTGTVQFVPVMKVTAASTPISLAAAPGPERWQFSQGIGRLIF